MGRGEGARGRRHRGRCSAVRSWSAASCGAGSLDERGSGVGRVGLPCRWLMLTPVKPPRARICVDSSRPDAAAGRWLVSWWVTNEGEEPLRIEDAWIPHGRFRGDGHVALNAEVLPGASHVLELRVTAVEPPGTVVENAFLILRARGWRIFARLRVEFDAASTICPVVEQVTVQSLQ